MSSIRVTNVLLAIITACLLAITSRDVLPDLLPAAFAQGGGAQAARPAHMIAHLHGCVPNNTGIGDQCYWRPAVMRRSVDGAHGVIVVASP
ncbi:hypothetical protein [Variovorax sp. LjRoot178]|uniref:hypothetical protein n=1 Tax=Variovorax sp. LjRoot178 TaxID=3342277 RepID=UPI003ED0FBED